MQIKEYTPADLADIMRVFESRDTGLSHERYPLPDFSDALLITKQVARTDSGEFIGCAFSRLLVETSLVLDDKAGSNRQRMHALWALHVSTRDELIDKGLDRAVAFVSPHIRGFENILERHGWQPEQERHTMTYSF
jgi:hypothetical protein